ncbi:MAG TPA: hypothetical protein VG944_20990 [Fimbriimonas sp.]|nr:hypothetical protein [Fimbriimonas sp.]
MTLQVPFDSFAKTAKKVAKATEAYLSVHVGGTLITSADPATNAHVFTVSRLSRQEIEKRLKAEGIEALEGAWAEEGQISLDPDPIENAFVAAVSYQSAEHIPGVWVDAYREQPSHVQVLRAWYDEFRETGEVGDVSFEEFVRLSNPNVVVVSSADLRRYIAAKTEKVVTEPAGR